MKKGLLAATGLLLGLLSFAQTNMDEEAIKKLVSEETKNAYALREKEYLESWVQAPYTFRAGNNRTGYYVNQGWASLETDLLKAFSKSNPRVVNPVLENFVFKFYGNEACFATYDQFLYGKENKPSKEVRVLEKQNGTWKIAAVVALWDYSKNKYEEDLVRKVIEKETDAHNISDYEAHIASSTAWATYTQDDIKEGKTMAQSRQVRILERIDGAWKIVFVGLQTLPHKP